MARQESRWRRQSREVIQGVLAGLPRDATVKEKRDAVSEAYPFGQRVNHPYKMWCREVEKTFAGQTDMARSKPTIRIRPSGVVCAWCTSKGCIACSNAWRKYHRVIASRKEWQDLYEAAALADGYGNSHLIYADWLDEHGLSEEAAYWREMAR